MLDKIDQINGIELYKDVLSKILEECKSIDDVYDVLLRGTSCDWKSIVPYWSDIDLTVVLNQINHSSLSKLRKIYKDIPRKYEFKISLTFVTVDDYLNQYHHHGSKPLYYNIILNNAHSLYGRTYPDKLVHNTILTKYDCFLNLIYLIHDLRKRFLELNENNKGFFLTHIIKRTKHLVRNSIFVITGYISEDINIEMCCTYFPSISPQFFDILQNFKNEYSQNMNQEDDMISFIFDNAEKIYCEILSTIEIYMEKQSSNL
jgi:hypothetical protein